MGEVMSKKIEETKRDQIVMLLPSYNPDEKLVKFVDELIAAGLTEIVVVDDGGKEDTQHYFDEVADKVHLVRHAVNQGKGRALKTGLNYIKLTYDDSLMGVIAADSDGQHPISAILDCKQAMIENPEKMILAVRRFAKGHVPLPNLLGNLITVGVFFGLTQTSFSDTQCGLRCFPHNILNDMIATHGERFEYENIMLIDVRKKGIDYVEVPMDAVYIEDNQTSHFNKVTDSIIIYRSILKFAVFPILAGLIGFLFSYLYFMNIGCLADRNILITYAAGALLSWLMMSFTIKNEKKLDTLYVVLLVAATTAIFFFLYKWLFTYAGAWWLTAIVAAPLSYALYLRARFGKKPKKTKFNPDDKSEETVTEKTEPKETPEKEAPAKEDKAKDKKPKNKPKTKKKKTDSEKKDN